MMKILLASAATLVFLASMAPAVAQEGVAPGSSAIDFEAIIAELMPYVAAALSAGLLYVLKLTRDWFKAKTGVELQISDEQMRAVLDRAIQYGIALVLGRLSGRARIAVSNAQVAQIANYVIAAVPGALRNFGITPERLQDMIRARIIAWTDNTMGAAPAPNELAARVSP